MAQFQMQKKLDEKQEAAQNGPGTKVLVGEMSGPVRRRIIESAVEALGDASSVHEEGWLEVKDALMELGLSSERLDKIYMQELERVAKDAEIERLHAEKKRARRRWTLWAVILCVLLVVGSVGYADYAMDAAWEKKAALLRLRASQEERAAKERAAHEIQIAKENAAHELERSREQAAQEVRAARAKAAHEFEILKQGSQAEMEQLRTSLLAMEARVKEETALREREAAAVKLERLYGEVKLAHLNWRQAEARYQDALEAVQSSQEGIRGRFVSRLERVWRGGTQEERTLSVVGRRMVVHEKRYKALVKSYNQLANQVASLGVFEVYPIPSQIDI